MKGKEKGKSGAITDNQTCRRIAADMQTYVAVGLMVACLTWSASRVRAGEVRSVNIVGFVKSGDEIVTGLVVEDPDSQSGSLDTTGQGEVVHHIVPMQDRTLTSAEFRYTTDTAGKATINGCDRDCSGALCIPNTLGGCPVVSISGFGPCTKLIGVTIPDGVTSIGNPFSPGAFSDCTRLEKIFVDDKNLAFSGSADGVLFNKDKTRLVCYPAGKAGSYAIPTNVTSVGSSAFSGCSRLTNVTIPRSVTNIGWYAFSPCAALTAITVDEANPNYGDVDGVLVSKNHTVLIKYPEGRDRNYTPPSGVTSFSIGAFRNCTRLTGVTMSGNITNIGRDAFSGCTRLERIVVDDKNLAFSSSADGVLFNKDKTTLVCYPLGKAGSCAIPGNVTKIGERAFSGCTRLEKIVVADRNLTFSSSADGVLFNKDKTRIILYPRGKAGSYVIPMNMTSIGSGTFSGCTRLTGVTIHARVSVIGNSAFADCTGLTSVTIPGSVTRIGMGAFSGCKGLTGVYFKGNAPHGSSTDDSILLGCRKAIVYYLPGTTGWGKKFSGRPTAPWKLDAPDKAQPTAGGDGKPAPQQ